MFFPTVPGRQVGLVGSRGTTTLPPSSPQEDSFGSFKTHEVAGLIQSQITSPEFPPRFYPVACKARENLLQGEPHWIRQPSAPILIRSRS